MNATAKENRLLRQENAELYAERVEQDELIDTLVHYIGDMDTLVGKCLDIMVRQDKENTSLTHILAIYSGADSPSGKDPNGYEELKAFLDMACAYEEARKEAGDVEEATEEDECEEPSKEPPKDVRPKPCGGRPGHKGVSHDVKSDRTIQYTAEICDECGRTDLELLPPINKLSVNFGKIILEDEEDEETDVKDAYTARVRFGWCGRAGG